MTGTVEVRAAGVDDAAAITGLRNRVYPFLVRTVAQTRRLIVEPRPGTGSQVFVATAGGELVGSTTAWRVVGSSRPDTGEISALHVAPEARGQGAGAALLTTAGEHLAGLGVRTGRAWVLPESVGFARRHGFEPSARMRYSGLDLAAVPSILSAPMGYRIAPIAELDPHRLHAADLAASGDEPGDVPYDEMPFEQWRYDVWDDPGMDHRIGLAALDGAEIVSFSLVSRDGERMWSDYTATVPEYRGRGLATLVKTLVLASAAADGVTTAYTSNDADNAAMLAINTKLGYRVLGEQYSCLGPVA